MNDIKFEDYRKKKIVFFSSCILNQNNRFPGIAVCEGGITHLIEPFLKEGIGIEQLPCLECMGWGGVSRKTIFKFLPVIFKHPHSKLIKTLSKIWLWFFKRKCQKEAKIFVERMMDYANSGYNIIGIIAMNDSPTCGATQTVKLLDSVFNHETLEIDLESFQSPRIEQMKKIMPKLIIKGQGLFMGQLISRLDKKKLNIKIIGFNPWSDLELETERIVKKVLN